MTKIWRRFPAWMRWSKTAICEVAGFGALLGWPGGLIGLGVFLSIGCHFNAMNAP